MRYTLLLLAALVACSATAPSIDGVEFRTDKASYDASDDLEVELVNGTAQTLTYDLCRRFWQYKVSGGWRASEEFIVCTGQLTQLEPGERITREVALPEGTAAGTWRLEILAGFGDERDTLSSNEFEVR